MISPINREKSVPNPLFSLFLPVKIDIPASPQESQPPQQISLQFTPDDEGPYIHLSVTNAGHTLNIRSIRVGIFVALPVQVKGPVHSWWLSASLIEDYMDEFFNSDVVIHFKNQTTWRLKSPFASTHVQNLSDI